MASTDVKTTGLAPAIWLVCGLVLLMGHAFEAMAKDHKPKPPVDDSKLNCKQLNGRVQLLILQARSYGTEKQGSIVARGLQSGFSSVFGNNPRGADPAGTHAEDLSKLQNYNRRLVDLGCKSYDLDAELKVQDPNETPTASVPAVKKPKPAPEVSPAQ